MRKAAAALTGALLFGAACTYYNAIYNAEHVFAEAERLRREGRDSVAEARYGDVIRKAAGGFRQDPDGRWAYDASYLMGRAHLRRGDLEAARAALRHSAALATTADERLAAQVYEGIVDVRLGHRDRALARFNEALAGATEPAVRAEGHLHRGRLLLERGQPDAGWWDLDRAASIHPPLRVEAAFERLTWAIALGDRARTEESINRLLSYAEAAPRAGAVVRHLAEAERRWGSDAAAALLARAENASWARDERDRMMLGHARLLHRAGRVQEAERQARRVADGRGPWAAEARLALASWALAVTADVGGVFGLRTLLLPAGDRAAAAALLADVEELESLAFRGLDEPLAWFVAGEVARDRLSAPRVARDLFLAYATSAPDEPWAAKSLLAALHLTSDEDERGELLGRLERHAGSPYVLAARGRPAVGFEMLEEELMARLSGIRR